MLRTDQIRRSEEVRLHESAEASGIARPQRRELIEVEGARLRQTEGAVRG